MRRAAVVLGLVLATAAGCTRPAVGQEPEPSEPATSAPAEVPETTQPPLPPLRTGTPSPTGFGEVLAVPCAGRPTPDQVLAAVRRNSNLLPSGVRATVQTGPVCAGTWQYTVIAVPDREPLQVVTRGAPTSLTLVTAGTDVCTVTVRTSAPPGIMTVAHCSPAG